MDTSLRTTWMRHFDSMMKCFKEDLSLMMFFNLITILLPLIVDKGHEPWTTWEFSFMVKCCQADPFKRINPCYSVLAAFVLAGLSCLFARWDILTPNFIFFILFSAILYHNLCHWSPSIHLHVLGRCAQRVLKAEADFIFVRCSFFVQS